MPTQLILSPTSKMLNMSTFFLLVNLSFASAAAMDPSPAHWLPDTIVLESSSTEAESQKFPPALTWNTTLSESSSSTEAESQKFPPALTWNTTLSESSSSTEAESQKFPPAPSVEIGRRSLRRRALASPYSLCTLVHP